MAVAGIVLLGCRAVYNLASSRLGAQAAGVDGLSAAMVVAALVIAPVAALAGLAVLGQSLTVLRSGAVVLVAAGAGVVVTSGTA